jgi:hypothetical protein
VAAGAGVAAGGLAGELAAGLSLAMGAISTKGKDLRSRLPYSMLPFGNAKLLRHQLSWWLRLRA